eukprot:g16035.t1
MKRVKKRRVKLPDPVHKQMLVVCKNKALGLKIKQLSSGIVIIKSFHMVNGAEMGPVEAHGECEIGDALMTVSEESIEFLSYKALLSKIKSAPRPMTLRFAKWDYEEEEDDEETDGGEEKREAPAANKDIKIYTSKDVPSAMPVLNQRRRCVLVAIAFLMCVSWFVGYRYTSGSTERRNKSSLQTIMQNFVRIRGHDNKNHTIKVLSHDDDGTITLDYKDLAEKDLHGVFQGKKDVKGVRKRRHKRDHESKKSNGDGEKNETLTF